MSIFDFLFKKKEEPVVNTIMNFRYTPIPIKEEDGTIRTEEYILAKNICSHLKVAGTKYYCLMTSVNEGEIELFLRCRYKNTGKRSIREPIVDLIKKCSAVVAIGTAKETWAINTEILLKGNIDYILIDKDEQSGEIFYYFSFKGLLDKDGEAIEGYLVVESKNDALVDYLCNLM